MKNYYQNEFQIEEEKTQDFLQKLNKFKKASKQIKSNNIQSTQKLEWNTELQRLQKQERTLDQDLDSDLLMIDMQIAPAFISQKFYFSSMKSDLKHKCDLFGEDLWYQVRSLKKMMQQKPSDLPPIKSALKATPQLDKVKELVGVISDAFTQIEGQLQNEFYQIKGQERLQNNEFAEQEEQEIIDEEFAIQEDDIQEINKKRQKIDFILSVIKEDFATDRLTHYLSQLHESEHQSEEILLIEEYSLGLGYLLERYEIECTKLKQAIMSNDDDLQQLMSDPLPQAMLYLASSNSIHCMQRLQLHYPKHGRQVLQGVVDWVRKCKDTAKRIEITRRRWKEEYNGLQGKSEKLLVNLLQERLQKNQAHQNQLEIKQNQQGLLQELQEKRIEYDERMRQKKQIDDKFKEEELVAHKKRQEQWLRHKEEIDIVASDFRDQREVKHQEDDQRNQQLQREKDKQIQEQIAKARPSVSMRQSQQEGKIYQKLNTKEAIVLQKEHNQDRIENAIQNYAFRPKVEIKNDRLLAETEGRQIRKNTKYDMADKVVLSKMTGYTIQQLMGDMRYRMQTVLNEAGLARTDYAKEIIIGMNRPR